MFTKFNLRFAREEVNEFNKIIGRNPKSLTEINEYAQIHQDSHLHNTPFKEYLSDMDGNRTEHKRLNGKGGFYYDPNYGEVKVNLTEPVGHYLWLYFGEKRNEIPADW